MSSMQKLQLLLLDNWTGLFGHLNQYLNRIAKCKIHINSFQNLKLDLIPLDGLKGVQGKHTLKYLVTIYYK